MITNERQDPITKAEAEKFKQALARMESEPTGRSDIHPRLVQAEREGLESQLQDLRTELEEYEALKRGDVATIAIDSFDELAIGLIKARIAAGLSQKALAERLGLKEQQIQRYEAERYASASYQRLQEIVRAIGVRVREEILLQEPAVARVPQLLTRLRHAGIKTDFLLSRLLPSSLATEIEEGVSGEDGSKSAAQVGDVMNRIFGWTRSELFGPAICRSLVSPQQRRDSKCRPADRQGRQACMQPMPTISQPWSLRVAEICQRCPCLLTLA